MAEPISTVSFEAIVDGKSRTINIGADLLSTKTMREAIALRAKRVMEEWDELLSMKEDLDEDTFKEESKRISQDRLYLKRNQSMDLAIEMFVDMDCMAIVIFNGCEDVHSLEEAKKVADACPNVIAFVQDITEYANEVLESVKNSKRPDDLEE